MRVAVAAAAASCLVAACSAVSPLSATSSVPPDGSSPAPSASSDGPIATTPLLQSQPASRSPSPVDQSDPPEPTSPVPVTSPPSATGGETVGVAPTHPTTTPQGMWWGVDSTGPITASALAAVRGWYQGATPQMWGRYIVGHYALHAGELAYARQQGIYVYLLVPDRNCSICDGGRDVCGNDETATQATADAQIAIQAADAMRISTGAVLFKDIEEVGSCRGEPTATYLRSWFDALQGSGYRVGIYGNTYRQTNDFPRAYCATAAADPEFAAGVIMDANEAEPAIGAPRNEVGPSVAPPFTPLIPACSAPTSTYIWQYGESTSKANFADADEMRPRTPGLLAPDGTVTGGS